MNTWLTLANVKTESGKQKKPKAERHGTYKAVVQQVKFIPVGQWFWVGDIVDEVRNDMDHARRILRRLVDDGMLRSETRSVGGRNRLYFTREK